MLFYFLLLLSHAFFKAILVMCVSLATYNMKDYQDIRKSGPGWDSLPITMSVMTMANMSLCGLFFLKSFYSKDLILEVMMTSGSELLCLPL